MQGVFRRVLHGVCADWQGPHHTAHAAFGGSCTHHNRTGTSVGATRAAAAACRAVVAPARSKALQQQVAVPGVIVCIYYTNGLWPCGIPGQLWHRCSVCFVVMYSTAECVVSPFIECGVWNMDVRAGLLRSFRCGDHDFWHSGVFCTCNKLVHLQCFGCSYICSRRLHPAVLACPARRHLRHKDANTLHCQGCGKAVLLESLQAWYLRRSHLRAQLQQLAQAHSAHRVPYGVVQATACVLVYHFLYTSLSQHSCGAKQQVKGC
jgi:hypothetical protein